MRSFDLTQVMTASSAGGSICFSHSSFSLRLLVETGRLGKADPNDHRHPMPLREDNVRSQLWQLWVYFNFLDTHAWAYNNIQFPWLGNRSVGSLPGRHSRFGKWGVGESV